MRFSLSLIIIDNMGNFSFRFVLFSFKGKKIFIFFFFSFLHESRVRVWGFFRVRKSIIYEMHTRLHHYCCCCYFTPDSKKNDFNDVTVCVCGYDFGMGTSASSILMYFQLFFLVVAYQLAFLPYSS